MVSKHAVSSVPSDTPSPYHVEWVALDTLKPHPRNYNLHPDEQIEHLAASITQHDFYRNVVIAEDGTLLAGHGVVQAARAAGRTHVPVKRMLLAPDDPEAIKIMVGDNETLRLSKKDERQLVTLLQEINDNDAMHLLGTGFDEAMLTALAEHAGVIVPDFQAVGVDRQGRLDQRAPITCPHCGMEFVP